LDKEKLAREIIDTFEKVNSERLLDKIKFTVKGENILLLLLEDFGGKMLNALSLSGKLLQQGWYRGSIVDGGGFFCFWREDKELGIGAELRFSGAAVGYDDGDDVTVYDAVFYTGTINRGSYVYDTIPDNQIVPLGNVPARYYSEIVHQLTRATASSTRNNENWRTEKES
jgi:hypothetical protein